ncbi:Two component system response regulator/histidine kinase, PAS domain-containing [Desulfonema limicola]|uniref:histidine kinase n=1 Tax=Desulfonema limicola TaxID=45656 RepID=A0A975B674_9BACT|nr:ATP-binding protein [Desulfonema limicola]QTA79524.1 Two component system response regulator/histidine kinase, PAS domain-containing [Desulfonema limicola]
MEDMEQKYEFIANASKDFMSLIDRNYIYKAVNKAYCDAHKKKREDIIGRSAADIWHEDRFNNNIKQYLDKCFAGNEVNYEQWFQFDGSERQCYNVSYYPYYNEKGEVTHAAVVSRDVTAYRQAEEERNMLEMQLRQTQKMEAIGQLAGGVAHEFNTLVGIILGYGDMLQDEIYENITARQYLNGIIDAGRRARTLIRQIKDFSRLDVLEHKKVWINEVVEQAVKMLTPLMASTIEIRYHAHEKLLILGNSNQIHQVILNLGVNARDAMSEIGGLLEISLEKVDIDYDIVLKDAKSRYYAKLSISDSGTGMEKKIADRIFEPFFTTKNVGEGSGMGLAIVYGIIKRHEGFISVKSEPGAGSIFNIYLPLIKSG